MNLADLTLTSFQEKKRATINTHSTDDFHHGSSGGTGSMPAPLEESLHPSANNKNNKINSKPVMHDLSYAEGGGSRRSNHSDGSSMSEFDEDDDDVENLQDKAAKATRNTLARNETRAVSALRYVVLLVLLLTAIGVSLATFFYSRKVEADSFQAEFASVAVVTLRSFVEAVEHRLTAMDAVAAGVTSHALSSGETFPNVTVPDFEVKGATLRTQTDSIFSFWLPLVTDKDRAGYEAYCQPHQGHIFQSYVAEEGLRQYQDAYFGINKTETQATDQAAEETTAEAEQDMEEQEADITNGGRRQLHVGTPEEHPGIHDGIWGLTSTNDSWLEPEDSGPYLPLWQMSPTVPMPSIFNFNFLVYYDLAPMMRQVLDTGKATLSYLQTNHTGSNTEDIIRVILTMNQYRHEQVDYNADPMTQVAYPVFDTFNPTTKKVTGMMVTTIFWRLLFANVLPESVKGVVCVLRNTLGDEVTYQIDGHTAVYMGTGDLHDPQYDDMVVTRDISEFLLERASIETTSYTSVELDGGYTSYSIHVYPSETMEDSYLTTDPIIYAVVVAFIFIFTSLVFMFYDCLVEKRQRKVMDKAVKSTAVVTSLFPEAVHERLFADNNKSEELSKEMDVWRSTSKELTMDPTLNDVMALRSSQRTESKTVGQIASVYKKKGRPIADKFPNVTVLFADLAGFTKWSSTREPDEVFVLLEALYGAFDKVALRRQVFKVETIGDCYMACTGLPKPQPDHATRMVKFARDCQVRMNRLLNDLSTSLGDDTTELVMRIGLHSGPVTAGVLRGDKGRFQLFGDTVNTASRMESHGVKGRIHVSDSTAKLLPDKWITMREDKIVAKGKGEMTTYFVDPGTSGRSSVGGRSSIGYGSKHSYESSSLDFEEEEGGEDGNINPQYLHSLGIPFSTSTDVGKDSSFEDEPLPRSLATRRPSLAEFGQNIAQKLGITEEVEV